MINRAIHSKFLLAFVAAMAVAQVSFATVVEFRIPAGTGKKAWNSRTNPVEVKVGQTLRIINGDSIAHYLHTTGDPCAHGKKPFGPSESYDCVITTVADPDTNLLYDHQFGPKSRFYVRATN